MHETHWNPLVSGPNCKHQIMRQTVKKLITRYCSLGLSFRVMFFFPILAIMLTRYFLNAAFLGKLSSRLVRNICRTWLEDNFNDIFNVLIDLFRAFVFLNFLFPQQLARFLSFLLSLSLFPFLRIGSSFYKFMYFPTPIYTILDILLFITAYSINDAIILIFHVFDCIEFSL